MVYAGFWRRFAAYLIDAIVLMLPSILFFFKFGVLSFEPNFVNGVFSLSYIAFCIWYKIFLVEKKGGTWGKLVMKIRISMKDGTPVNLRAASIRFVVGEWAYPFWLLWGAIGVLFNIAGHNLLSFMGEGQILSAIVGAVLYATIKIYPFWIFGDGITMLFNKERRAFHDFIAGTVVISTEKPVASEPV